MAKYKDWRKFDPLTMRNEQIRNTPEQARGGYSALDPLATGAESVPTPDWAKRTPTEQARVNAAQARAQAGATAQGYAALAPASAPVSPYAVPVSPYDNPNRVTPVPGTSTQEGRTRLANSQVQRENETYAGWGSAPTKQDYIRLEGKTPVREYEGYAGIGNALTKDQLEAAWARAEADRASGRRIEETYAGWGDAPTKIDRTRPYADQLNPNRRMQDTYEGWAEKKPVGLKIPVRENETYAGWGDFPTKGERRLAQDGDRFQNETYGGWGDAPTKQDRARLEGKTPAREMDEGYIEEHARMEAIRNRMANRIPIREEETYAGRVSLPKKETNANTQGYDAFAPATEPKTDAGSPSTGETELTGYAKYLADHPEFADADRRAEAEYARSLPTYGALAERMAQAGIHGGFSDYLQGVAYAKMQDVKQQNEEAARAGYAALTGNGGVEGTTNAQIGAMYEMFGKGGYTDAEGNTVQGYNLLEIVNDEDYENAKARARADAINQGADEATVDEALKRVDEMRGTVKEQIQTGVSDKMTKYNEGKLEPADLIAAIGYTPSEGEDESVAFLSALDYAVENKLISPEQRSEALKVGLSLYGEKPSAKDVLKSIKTAIDLNDEGAMTDEDKNAVLEDALKAVETYFKGKKWTVKIENGKLYAKNTAGAWEDLGNLKYKSEFETRFRGSYYDDVVKLVYENRNKK